ncbi:PIN domain-containing protein [Plasmodiophora brassicae]
MRALTALRRRALLPCALQRPYPRRVVAVARRPYTRTVDVRPVERAGPCRTLLPLSVMPHNYVYLVDSTLIIGYARDEFPGWRAWAEEHVRNGRTFYVLPPIVPVATVHGPELPDGFVALQMADEASLAGLQDKSIAVFRDVVAELDLKGRTVSRMEAFTRFYATARAYVEACDRSQIASQDLELRRVIFLTSNFGAASRLMSNRAKVNTLEMILSRYDIAGLLKLRYVSNQHSWHDFN